MTFAVLTIYTLFAPNILLALGLSVEHTEPFLLLNTVVLCFFGLEALLNCVFVNGYMRSGRVFLDLMAMVSLAGDTLVHAHLPNGSSVDLVRSARILDILKFARLFRIVQRPGCRGAIRNAGPSMS